MLHNKYKYLEAELNTNVFQTVIKIQNMLRFLDHKTTVIITLFRIYDSLINWNELKELKCSKHYKKNQIVLLFDDCKNIEIDKILSESFEEGQVEMCFYICNSDELVKNVDEYSNNRFKKMPYLYSIVLFEGCLYLKFEKQYYNKNKIDITQMIDSIVS